MKKADLDQVKLVVRDAVHEVMEPVNENIRKLNQSVYGVNGDNGLCGSVKALNLVAEDYKVKKGQLVLIAAAIGGAVSWVAKIIPNPFAK